MHMSHASKKRSRDRYHREFRNSQMEPDTVARLHAKDASHLQFDGRTMAEYFPHPFVQVSRSAPARFAGEGTQQYPGIPALARGVPRLRRRNPNSPHHMIPATSDF